MTITRKILWTAWSTTLLIGISIFIAALVQSERLQGLALICVVVAVACVVDIFRTWTSK